jgi:hypothetical protein
VVAALPLSACGSSTSLLDTAPKTSESQLLTGAGARPVNRLVTFRTAAGPPDDVNLELSRHLNDAAIDQGIALISDPNIKADFTLRGYLSAMRKGSSVNLSYLWDVLDERGQRVTRLEGEEALTGNVDVKKPWSAITPAVSRSIAQRSMTDLSNWLKANPGSGARIGQAAPSPPSGLTAPPPTSGAPQRLLPAAERLTHLD